MLLRTDKKLKYNLDTEEIILTKLRTYCENIHNYSLKFPIIKELSSNYNVIEEVIKNTRILQKQYNKKKYKVFNHGCFYWDTINNTSNIKHLVKYYKKNQLKDLYLVMVLNANIQ